MLEQGTRLNDTYVLEKQLGSGGGGIVYKAYHERLQKYVVVKQIKDQVKGILEGRAEADILKELKHANLPQVYDFLEIDGEIYTVMDFVPGESMDKSLEKQGAFDSRIVYKWALQLADALKYLHSQNPPVIHSDIKPANIMLTPKGDICLIDFNISLAFDEGQRTSTGISGGYSPPEQHHDFYGYQTWIGTAADRRVVATDNLRSEVSEIDKTVLLSEQAENSSAESGTVVLGESKKSGIEHNPKTKSIVSDIVGRGVDERSDIYSLGATLYHLITGIKPTDDYEAIIPISKFNIKLGEGFRTIIEKMMELDPAKRYQNGGDLFYALEHVYELDNEYKSFKRKRRNIKILAVTLYIVGIALAGSGWKLMDRERLTAYNRTVEAASTYIAEANYSQAEEAIEEAIGLLPNHIAAYEREILRLYSMGDYDETIAYARDMINNPAYTVEGEVDEEILANMFYVLGNAYLEKEDYSNAANCFQTAIEKDLGNSLYFRDYAIVLAKSGQSDMAENELKAAIGLGLGEDSIYMVQGEIAYSRGDDISATKWLLDSVRSSEDEELKRRATILCTQAYRRLGDEYLDQEIEMIETSMNSFGVEASMHMKEQLADAYARMARQSEENAAEYYPKSLKTFQELYESGYSTRQMMENIAILYQQMDRMEDAEMMLNQMAEKYPEDYRSYKRLAFLEADKQQKRENEERDYIKMKEFYDKAVELYQQSKIDGDTEMQMLENMMQDLADGGWL